MIFTIRNKPLPFTPPTNEEQNNNGGNNQKPAENLDKLYLNTLFKCKYGDRSGLGLVAMFSIPIFDLYNGTAVKKVFEHLAITYTPTGQSGSNLNLNVKINIPGISLSFTTDISIPLTITQLSKRLSAIPEAYLQLSISEGKKYINDICQIEVWTGNTNLPPKPKIGKGGIIILPPGEWEKHRNWYP